MFEDEIPKELFKKLPPRRKEDHKIELEPNTKRLAMSPYRYALLKLQELKKQLQDLLDARYIRPLKTLFNALILFQKNKDELLRICFDYLALNKVIV